MADPTTGHDEGELAAIARHALHDEELVAAFAAGDLEDAIEQERARALVERCATCRDIHRDLAVIRTAIRASGTAAERAATMSAPRDFRLTADDAARLRPGSPIARVARRLGWRARLDLGVAAFGRPVGAAMATFGVVGLLIGSLTLGGGPGSLFSAQSAAGPTSAPGAEGSGPATSTIDGTNFGPAASGQDTKNPVPVSGGRDTGTQGVATVALLGGSIAFLALGIALFVAARRRAATVAQR
ncbi:MAG: hypothetical protein E6I65_01545 [Chloroflexi bacterium]|nr:MAG: hypothetical protein E6I65_01545 [Chloroflexota bacterium]